MIFHRNRLLPSEQTHAKSSRRHATITWCLRLADECDHFRVSEWPSVIASCIIRARSQRLGTYIRETRNRRVVYVQLPARHTSNGGHFGGNSGSARSACARRLLPSGGGDGRAAESGRVLPAVAAPVLRGEWGAVQTTWRLFYDTCAINDPKGINQRPARVVLG